MLFAFYNIYFIGRWGQTIGKMALRIKVVSLSGNEAGFVRAFRRHSVDLAFAVVSTGLTLYALSSFSSAEFDVVTVKEKLQMMGKSTHAWDEVVNNLSMVWVVSELVVLLMNKKRRALHDFIAGTVVVHTGGRDEGR